MELSDSFFWRGLITHKPEFPPLLSDGLHPHSKSELKKLCVDDFLHSTTRGKLWENLEEFLIELTKLGLRCVVWVDGSYVTQKINPGDIDLILDFEVSVLDALTIDQCEFIERVGQQKFRSKGLHTFVMYSASSVDLRYAESVRLHKTWRKDFGVSYVTKEPKGIAVLEIDP
jgi:hypothetical protein